MRRVEVDAAQARGEEHMTFGGKVHDIGRELVGTPMRREAEAGLASQLRQAAASESGNAVGGSLDKWVGEVGELHFARPCILHTAYCFF